MKSISQRRRFLFDLFNFVYIICIPFAGSQRIHDKNHFNLPYPGSGTSDRLLSTSSSSSSSSASVSASKDYYGSLIGRLDSHHHEASGVVYAVDESTIFIKSFTYDGTGPDAYFWAGSSNRPDASGFIIPDEKGSTKPLGAYRNKDVVLRLPEGRTFRDIKWLSIWCRKFTANFADILIPMNLVIPTPVEIQPLKSVSHGVRSGPITIVDAQTLLVPDFFYDGEGPAAHFWMSRGAAQSPKGIRLLNENGSSKPLTRFSGDTVLVSLPDDKTIWDYDWFGVYSDVAQTDLGSARIPQNIKVPPSPKMLGVKPEGKLNCEVLFDDLGFELRWVMDGDDIVMQLVGRVDPGEYMAFGLGKDDSKSDMVNSDAVVTWIDAKTRKGHAVDYFLSSKEACTGSRGVCPDVVLSKSASDSITLLHSSLVNGFSMITFKRPQLGVDDVYDQHVYSDGQQSINWAIGSLNDRSNPSYHRLKSSGKNFIDFARTPKWNCPSPDAPVETVTTTTTVPVPPTNNHGSTGILGHSILSPPTNKPLNVASVQIGPTNNGWDIPPIICPADRTFRAQIGPTGGKKGYQSITGKVGWGIAWYINGLLIPELVVERGKTYTFIVEGGNDQTHSSRRHPFYITDSQEGGFDYRPDEEKAVHRIFAGGAIRNDGQIVPVAEGRLCEWKLSDSSTNPDAFNDFFSFQRSLRLSCQPGKAGIIKWTPDASTPDIVYYQCWTHRQLGWKIRVVDSCENVAAASVLRVRHQQHPTSRSTVSSDITMSPSHRLNRANHGHNHHPVPAGSIVSSSLVSPTPKVPPRPVNPPPPPQPTMSNDEPKKRKMTMSKVVKKGPPKYSNQLTRATGVTFNLNPQIETWIYHPSSPDHFFTTSYEPHLPSSQPILSSPVMTFEPFFLPSYPLPPLTDDRPPMFIRQKLPPPIPLPRDQPLPTGPSALSSSLLQQGMSMSEPEVDKGGFVPIIINRPKMPSNDRQKTVWWKETEVSRNNQSMTRMEFKTPVKEVDKSQTSFSLPLMASPDKSDGQSETARYNISRYGYPFLESNRILPKSPSSTTSTTVPPHPTPSPAPIKVKHSTITKMKNAAPVPYRKVHKPMASPTVLRVSHREKEPTTTIPSSVTYMPNYDIVRINSTKRAPNSFDVVETVTLPPTTTTSPSSSTSKDNLKNHQGYPKTKKDRTLSYTLESGISYNPIYYDEGSTVNVSSTDHTILNHILSLIAVGESPPEVKVFKKKAHNLDMDGAYSTHVEVHQRMPK